MPSSSTLTTPTTIPGFTPLEPSQWAYYSGKVIEQGAVILGGVEQDFGFGLRQQYFHKTVILVLDHDENTFTKGIILNRPSNKVMEDDVNEGLQWKVWFGGDVQGMDSLLPDIVCLHSLRSKEASDASVSVMKDIQWTSFANAKKLVKKGIASGPEDFWLFAGYAGWGPGQLSGELDRKSWYMCATDSRTLLKELARQRQGIDPRDAGLETWTLLMNMIGKGDTAKKCIGGFDDLMLKEWSQANLVRFDDDEIGLTREAPFLKAGELMTDESNSEISKAITAGILLRGSSAERSPFLLEKQQFHHSIILVLLSSDTLALGCMLNHPATKCCEIGGKAIPVRYGGDYAIKGQSPMMWLHSSQTLRDLGVGTPSGEHQKDIFKCTQEEATKAILCGVANANDFLVMSGVCVWSKLSLTNDVKRGLFELVDSSKVHEVISALQNQDILTEYNLEKNISFGEEAWWMAGVTSREKSGYNDEKNQPGFTKRQMVLGIGEGFDEEDEAVVFNSNKKVSELANDALRKWVATFLLGAPTLSSS